MKFISCSQDDTGQVNKAEGWLSSMKLLKG